MATAAVQLPQSTPISSPQVSIQSAPKLDKPKGRDIHTTLNYHKPNADGSPPHPTYTDRPETYQREVEVHPVTIHDVTGRESEFTLDGNGFQFIKHTSKEKEFVEEEKIKEYYDEIAQFLKDVTGASRVFMFDHTIRRSVPLPDKVGPLRGPVQRVHVDQSYSASLARVSLHLPDLAPSLLKSRVQIINVWRPIKTVKRDPLGIADASSVSDSDLVVTPLIYPNRRGETYGVLYSEKHQWYYKDRLTPDEVILIKCFDSKIDGRARRVPHSAFVDPEAREDEETRESIEVRALVFHEDQSHE